MSRPSTWAIAVRAVVLPALALATGLTGRAAAQDKPTLIAEDNDYGPRTDGTTVGWRETSGPPHTLSDRIFVAGLADHAVTELDAGRSYGGRSVDVDEGVVWSVDGDVHGLEVATGTQFDIATSGLYEPALRGQRLAWIRRLESGGLVNGELRPRVAPAVQLSLVELVDVRRATAAR